MELRGLKHNEFARMIGMKQNSLSDLKLRQETPAPDRATIHRWAMVLTLSKIEEEKLFELVQLAYTPLYVQEIVARCRSPKLIRRVAESPLDDQTPE